MMDPAPFEFCPVFGPGDAIAERRGQFELLKSRLHAGTGARVQKVLQKAMSGSPVTISVLGGSSKRDASPSRRIILIKSSIRLRRRRRRSDWREMLPS